MKLTLKSSFLNLKLSIKVERISTKKLDNVLSTQKSSHDKTGLGYNGERSSSSEPKKEVRFILAKNIEKFKEVKPKIENPAATKRTIGARPNEKGKSLHKKSKGASSEACVSSL